MPAGCAVTGTTSDNNLARMANLGSSVSGYQPTSEDGLQEPLLHEDDEVHSPQTPEGQVQVDAAGVPRNNSHPTGGTPQQPGIAPPHRPPASPPEGTASFATAADAGEPDEEGAADAAPAPPDHPPGKRRPPAVSALQRIQSVFTEAPGEGIVEPLDQPEPGSPYNSVVKRMKGILVAIQRGIDAGNLPELVTAGSSGSYWLRSEQPGSGLSNALGIFKPKSEEPYGPANPKWAKYFQRILCPCCFGRSCLLPNTGYLSEAGAFAIDCALDLRVVPPTQILQLRATPFNYNKMQRAMRRLPLKIGSFQAFCQSKGNGRDIEWDEITPSLKPSFLDQFQRLVVLDYMIRNTDRGLDNWLINIYVDTDGKKAYKIHAIDNGLAFPFKHPDNWRTYPPSWASHQLGRIPFTDGVRAHVLRKIGHPSFMAKIETRLREIFRHDSAFGERGFQGQISVIRGQQRNLYNLLMREDPQQRTPEALFAMHPLFIVKKETEGGRSQLIGWETHLPCFSCC